MTASLPAGAHASGERLSAQLGLTERVLAGPRMRKLLRVDSLNAFEGPRTLTYPSRVPVAQLDHIYARGLHPLSLAAPRGRIWSRMSDHLPLIAEFRMDGALPESRF